MLPSSLPNQKHPPTSRGSHERIWLTKVHAVCCVDVGRSLKYFLPSTL